MPADADTESTRTPEEALAGTTERHAHDGGHGTGKSSRRSPIARKGDPRPPFMREPETPRSRSGNVVYLSGDALDRPLDPPKGVRGRATVLVAIAAVIGAVFLGFYLDGMVNGPVREQALVDEYVSKEADLGLPDLKALLPLDDAGITAKLQETGATIFERSQAGGGKPFEVIKLPQDVSLADAGALYLKGVSSLSAAEAAKLLNGSWDLTVNRDNGMNMGLHYADFSSGSLERAVSAAAHSQGFDTEGDVESGVDSSGNTYIQGNIEAAGEAYSWKVSAVPLSEVYSQKGLPDTAAYVGIRLYR